jgi:hypothetical protein
MKTAIDGYRKIIVFVVFGLVLFAGLWATLRVAGTANLLPAAALYGAFAGPLATGFATLMNAFGKSYAANAEIAVGQIAATPQTATTAQSANVQVVAAAPVPP